MKTEIKIKEGVAKIVEKSQDIEKDINTFVKEKFKKSITVKNQTSAKIKKITKDTLEGVRLGIQEAKEKGFKFAEDSKEESIKMKDIMAGSAESMVDEAKVVEQKALESIKTSLDKAKEVFDKASHKAENKIEDIDATTKEHVKEALINLKDTKDNAKSKLEAIRDAITDYARGYPRDRKNETSEVFHNAVEKSKEAVVELMNAAKHQSKELTSHSLSKTADWLKNLSNKVNS